MNTVTGTEAGQVQHDHSHAQSAPPENFHQIRDTTIIFLLHHVR